jgi:ectoine hydroxylase-related dioxygenase (phytanoyl-CoA dioxygenase family)
MIGESFAEDGYWVSPTPLFSPEQLDRIRDHFDAVINGDYVTGTSPHGVDRFGDSMVKVSNAWWADHIIRSVVLDPRISLIAADLLGVDELYLWADSLYWKTPHAVGEAAVIGWHQDKQYWKMSSTDDMITACVALYDANAETGGLRFVPGSHRWGLVGGSEALVGSDNAGVHGHPPAPLGQHWEEVCPVLVSGQVTFHHALTFHGSGPNRSAMPRRSITIHMVSGHGRLVPPVNDNYFSTVGLGHLFRGPLFPRVWPPEGRVGVGW